MLSHQNACIRLFCLLVLHIEIFEGAVQYNSHGYLIDTPQWNSFPHVTRKAKSTQECLTFCARKHTPCNAWIFDAANSICYFKNILPFFRDPWPGDPGVRIVGFSKHTDLDHPFNMTITEEPYVDQGSPFTLTCTLHSGGPNTTIIWKQDGIQLFDGITSLATGEYPNVFLTSTLTYQFVSPYESTFECISVIASFELTRASTLVQLRVEPNSVTVNKKCNAGSGISITCNIASGNPVPEVTWTRNGVTIGGFSYTPGPTNVVSVLTRNEGGYNDYFVYKCISVLAGKQNISAESRGVTKGSKPIQLLGTVHNPDGTWQCRVKEGFNLGMGGGDNFDMAGHRSNGRLNGLWFNRGLLYMTGVRACFDNGPCYSAGTGGGSGMSWGSDDWVIKVKVKEAVFAFFPPLVFTSLRKVEVWTKKGRYLGHGFDSKTKSHEISRPRCKLSYFTGKAGTRLDHLNAVWEC